MNLEMRDKKGSVTMLNLRFVKTGFLPVDLVKQFKLLLSRRTDVDSITITSQRVSL
jgi:uncharacterized protein (UPF0332 family)